MRSLIVSFYTPEYSEIVKNLIRSLKEFKLPYEIEKRKSLGSWMKNNNQKPAFILEKLKQYDKIVWLDADAVVKRYPAYFDLIEEDIAVNYPNKIDLFAATILLRNIPTVRSLIEKWVEKTEEVPHIIEQTHLKSLVHDYQIDKKINIFYLPDTYCYVVGRTRRGKPVILQTQASRKMKGDD